MWGGAQTPCATLESRGTWSLTLLPPPPGHQNSNFPQFISGVYYHSIQPWGECESRVYFSK